MVIRHLVAWLKGIYTRAKDWRFLKLLRHQVIITLGAFFVFSKPPLSERFSKMVRFALRLCARTLHSASFAIAQDLGRFFQSASSILRRLHPAPRFRTENYDEYRQLEYKLELFLDKIEDTNADNILINC